MDKSPENGKKLSLLVIGELPAVLSNAGALALATLPTIAPGSLRDSYVIVAAPPEEMDRALDSLAATGLPPDQVLAYLPPEQSILQRRFAGYGLIERLEGENAEELRARIFTRIEAQRQKKLVTALIEAYDAGIARRLGEAELSLALDAARISHALACGYGLPPSAHARVLQAALAGGGEPGGPWADDIAADRLIPAVALTLAARLQTGGSARDVIREKAATLSFRARTELLHQLESCLGLLFGGKHAA